MASNWACPPARSSRRRSRRSARRDETEIGAFCRGGKMGHGTRRRRIWLWLSNRFGIPFWLVDWNVHWECDFDFDPWPNQPLKPKSAFFVVRVGTRDTVQYIRTPWQFGILFPGSVISLGVRVNCFPVLASGFPLICFLVQRVLGASVQWEPQFNRCAIPTRQLCVFFRL